MKQQKIKLTSTAHHTSISPNHHGPNGNMNAYNQGPFHTFLWGGPFSSSLCLFQAVIQSILKTRMWS